MTQKPEWIVISNQGTGTQAGLEEAGGAKPPKNPVEFELGILKNRNFWRFHHNTELDLRANMGNTGIYGDAEIYLRFL